MSGAEPPKSGSGPGVDAPVVSREDGGFSRSRRSERRWVRTLRDLMIGLFLAYWLGEFLVIQIWGEQAKFPRRVVEAPWGLRYNDPGASYRHKSPDVNIRIDINNQGMRSETDYGYPKPEGTIRVVSLGDSFTIGYEVDETEAYSSVLEERLRSAGFEAEVLNAGVSGFSTAEAVLYFERELIKYDPDVVVISFFTNDFVDNVRTNLFSLGDDGALLEENRVYLPLGRLGNTLNSNPIFNFFSAYSNSFVLVKERMTLFVKGLMMARNTGEAREAAEQELQVVDPTRGAAPYQGTPYQMRLTLALLERLYEFCRTNGIPLIVQVIPAGGIVGEEGMPEFPLVDPFPYAGFNPDRPGLAVLPTINLLQPHYGREKLVHARSARHWTPFAHQLVGDALAELLLEFDEIRPSAAQSANLRR